MLVIQGFTVLIDMRKLVQKYQGTGDLVRVFHELESKVPAPLNNFAFDEFLISASFENQEKVFEFTTFLEQILYLNFKIKRGGVSYFDDYCIINQNTDMMMPEQFDLQNSNATHDKEFILNWIEYFYKSVQIDEYECDFLVARHVDSPIDDNVVVFPNQWHLESSMYAESAHIVVGV